MERLIAADLGSIGPDANAPRHDCRVEVSHAQAMAHAAFARVAPHARFAPDVDGVAGRDIVSESDALAADAATRYAGMHCFIRVGCVVARKPVLRMVEPC